MNNTLKHIRDNKTTSFESANRNLQFLLIMLSVVLWTTSCKILSKETSSSGGSGSSDDPTTVRAQPAASPFERELPPPPSPRAFEYANLQFTVTKAVITNRPTEDLPMNNLAAAEITFSIVNTLKDTVRIPSGLWQLRLGDGSVYKKPYSENIDPRDTKERKISFAVPSNAQWTGAQLVLDEQGKEPATLLLDGAVPPPQYPVQLATDGEATTKEPQIVYTVQKASLDVDAFGERAALGKRYLNLTVHIADKEMSDNGEFLPEFFRLLIDGEPLLPKDTSDNSTVEPQSTQDYTMAYLIPANATSVELEVGKPDVQKTAKISIDLKKDTPIKQTE